MDVDIKENVFLCRMYKDNVMDIYESKDAPIVFSCLPDEYATRADYGEIAKFVTAN